MSDPRQQDIFARVNLELEARRRASRKRYGVRTLGFKPALNSVRHLSAELGFGPFADTPLCELPTWYVEHLLGCTGSDLELDIMDGDLAEAIEEVFWCRCNGRALIGVKGTAKDWLQDIAGGTAEEHVRAAYAEFEGLSEADRVRRGDPVWPR